MDAAGCGIERRRSNRQGERLCSESGLGSDEQCWDDERVERDGRIERCCGAGIEHDQDGAASWGELDELGAAGDIEDTC